MDNYLRLKRRSIFPSLTVLILVLLPLFVSAQGITECCRLHRNISVRNLTYAGSGAICSFVPGSTTLEQGQIIGAGDCINNGTEPDTCFLKETATQIDIESAEWGTICLLESVYSVTDWIFYFLMAVAVFMGLLAAKMFTASVGNLERISRAKEVLTLIEIGIVVAALVKSIPIMIRTIVGF